jgi:hypothetical protein
MNGYIGPIKKISLKNQSFRQVLFTGKDSWFAVMRLQPQEEIPWLTLHRSIGGAQAGLPMAHNWQQTEKLGF